MRLHVVQGGLTRRLVFTDLSEARGPPLLIAAAGDQSGWSKRSCSLTRQPAQRLRLKKSNAAVDL